MAQASELAPSRPTGYRPPPERSRLGLPLLLTLPTLIVVFLVIGVPLVYSLVLSLYRINMLTKRWVFVGLRNYLEVLPHPDFIAAMARTAYFAGSRSAAGSSSASPWRWC